jgi:hypothetical protein
MKEKNLKNNAYLYKGTKRGTNIENREPNQSEYKTPSHLSKWTEDAVIQEVYRVAPIVYDTVSWKNTFYEKDDFVQDAAMFVLKLYRKNYFATDRDNIGTIIYKLLSGFFLLNKH